MNKDIYIFEPQIAEDEKKQFPFNGNNKMLQEISY
jgi:hypothetical protein